MIGIIAGTNRPQSRSLQLSALYQRVLQEKNQPSQLIDLSRLPSDFTVSALYTNNGKNPVFNEFIQQVRSCDKLVFIIPEYNGSFPGVLKAFVDGFDYPSSFKNKKTALVGISSGDLGAALALSHFTDVLHYLGAQVLSQKVRFQGIDKALQEGQLLNPKHLEYLHRQAEALLAY
ncbi:MAG: NAD(P)H-dependent oxidoreductase [Cytophagaceae bacterium]|jgi:NAD(P)H-dependent FMN reductase|nr:NAD(P)H-dependent oxidoreductase [Cytophagaceae bacterium]